jgi:hypothetical protein
MPASRRCDACATPCDACATPCDACATLICRRDACATLICRCDACATPICRCDACATLICRCDAWATPTPTRTRTRTCQPQCAGGGQACVSGPRDGTRPSLQALVGNECPWQRSSRARVAALHPGKFWLPGSRPPVSLPRPLSQHNQPHPKCRHPPDHRRQQSAGCCAWTKKALGLQGGPLPPSGLRNGPKPCPTHVPRRSRRERRSPRPSPRLHPRSASHPRMRHPRQQCQQRRQRRRQR